MRVLLDGERRVIETKPLLALHPSRAERPHRTLDQLGGHYLPLETLRHLLGRLGGIAEVSQKTMARVFLSSNYEKTVRSRVATQVAHVHGGTHEQPVDPQDAQLRRKSGSAQQLVHAEPRSSSAR